MNLGNQWWLRTILETKDRNSKKIFINSMRLSKNWIIFVEPQGSRPFTLEFSMFDSWHGTTTGLADSLIIILCFLKWRISIYFLPVSLNVYPWIYIYVCIYAC